MDPFNINFKVFGSNKITCVHVKDNIGHKKFTLAHESAHYLFDFNDEKNSHYYDTYFPERDEESIEEKRANQFASNLLIPENEFRQVYKTFKKLQNKIDIINSLEQYFFVSFTAITFVRRV